ncbi:SCO family protein [Paraburkholderia sp. PREW-6R]|uniref:SCO family protein n=1 Tax=Paraburkholderia sp. PREW-6R TaxID=3141544 RepID=UPI0031F50C9F
MNSRPHSAGRASARQSTRRAVLRGLLSIPFATLTRPSMAQHVGIGLVDPPVRLTDTWLTDQNGKRRLLSDLLDRRVTALQTIYTGCSSVCPLQGALFNAVQERLPSMNAHYPFQLLSIGIDPLSDTPAALHEWLTRFQAGPAWTGASPSLNDVDKMRTALSGNTLPLGDISSHSTQIYCFDAKGMLRWRSADLPRAEEICEVLTALERA